MDITLTQAILLTLLAVAAAIGGMHQVRRTVSYARLREHNEITDPMLAVLGTWTGLESDTCRLRARKRF